MRTTPLTPPWLLRTVGRRTSPTRTTCASCWPSTAAVDEQASGEVRASRPGWAEPGRRSGLTRCTCSSTRSPFNTAVRQLLSSTGSRCSSARGKSSQSWARSALARRRCFATSAGVRTEPAAYSLDRKRTRVGRNRVWSAAGVSPGERRIPAQVALGALARGLDPALCVPEHGAGRLGPRTPRRLVRERRQRSLLDPLQGRHGARHRLGGRGPPTTRTGRICCWPTICRRNGGSATRPTDVRSSGTCMPCTRIRGGGR